MATHPEAAMSAGSADSSASKDYCVLVNHAYHLTSRGHSRLASAASSAACVNKVPPPAAIDCEVSSLGVTLI